MRKNFMALTAGILLTTAAVAQKQERETLEGNGNLVTKEIAVTSFSEIKASGVYELRLSQGSKESVKIEADENLQDLFEVKNEGNKLVIDTKKMNNINLKSKNKMRVYVTFKSIKNLEISTVGNVGSDDKLTFDDLQFRNSSVGHVELNMTANKLDMDNKSVGDVKLSGKAQNAVLVNNGVGSIKAGDFLVQTMNIENTGVGNAEVNAEKELKVKDSMLGKVKNKGAAPVRKTNKVVI
ncbi:MAG TPA: head GIN domain-containing protein [Flavisolibacter sp.]|nr:head GIN domain-containing protein [Flavisolibacter sp.]